MPALLQFTLNGSPRSAVAEDGEKIIDVLRETLNLTGTKRGCDDGTCGACTIVLDGEAKRACLLPAAKLEGATVLTIEGLARGMDVHPIQQALIDAGAVQCGYCIPGIVLELYALFAKNLDASADEIKIALSRHFCRCTGYEAIWEGALLAQKYMKEQLPQ
jgi:aerobic carbon-monoxide dehydrogenase small subunit